MNPTPKELLAMVEAMTPGTYSPYDTNTGGYHIEAIPPSEEPKELRQFVACWVRDRDARGFVALRNHFAALMERYERMRAALAYYANKSNYASKLTPGGGSWYMEIELDDGDRAIEAIADADKPLESRS